ncbi:MAG: cytochrome c biogenesis protein CcsA [Gammaproteobacteria bacterium]|nr:cytochrome c biogenesis protein CcsA [Gammaproteobacteria bacterium]
MAVFTHWTTIVLYLLTTIAAVFTLTHQQSRKPIIIVLFGSALLAHGLSLSQTLITPAGYRFDLLEMLTLITWSANLLILIRACNHSLTPLILVMAPFAAVTEFLATHAWGDVLPRQQLPTGIAAHALLSISAYALLTLATLQALYLYYLNKQLHRHRPAGISRYLPPLQTMESILFGLIAFGQLLLTASLITGFLFVHDLFAQHLAHKTVLSIAAWLLYSILLWGHWRCGWRGNTAVRWTLTAFAALMLAYFGSKLALEVILQRN